MYQTAVFGAAGQVGSLLVTELERRGVGVHAVSRSEADLTDPAQARAAAEGAEVIFHVAAAPYADWPRRLPALMDAAIEAARAHGAVLVYLDNLYGDGPGENPLCRLRAGLAAQLVRSGIRSVIVRVSDFYGLGRIRSTPQALVLDRLARRRSAQWPFRADQAHALHFLPDVARGLAVIGTSARTTGGSAGSSEVWTLPAAPALTGAEFAQAAAQAFDRPDRVSVLSKPMLRMAGLINRDARDLASLAYQYTAPFLLNAEATAATHASFGADVAPTSHDEALALVAAG